MAVYKKGYIRKLDSSINSYLWEELKELYNNIDNYSDIKGMYKNTQNAFASKNNTIVIHDSYCYSMCEHMFKYLISTTKPATLNFNDRKFVEIVYEEITREDGVVFARELLTGLIFPIYNRFRDDSLCLDAIKNYYSYESKDYKLIFVNPNVRIDGLARVNSIVVDTSVATYTKVEEYLKNTSHKDEIYALHKENVFEIPFKEKHKKEQLSEEMEIFNKIEYYLSILKGLNVELYNKRKEYYDGMLEYSDVKEINTNIGLDKLQLFEKRLKFDIIYGNHNDNVASYIDADIKKCQDYFLTGVGSDSIIDLKLIDEYCDIFLKFKDDCTLKEQSMILKSLSRLYLFCCLINTISVDDVKESYFKDLMFNIIAASEGLCAQGIIDVPINLNANEITLSRLIDEIDKYKKCARRKVVSFMG